MLLLILYFFYMGAQVPFQGWVGSKLFRQDWLNDWGDYFVYGCFVGIPPLFLGTVIYLIARMW